MAKKNTEPATRKYRHKPSGSIVRVREDKRMISGIWEPVDDDKPAKKAAAKKAAAKKAAANPSTDDGAGDGNAGDND